MLTERAHFLLQKINSQKKILLCLLLIYSLAVLVRLLYFPGNWFFGYEQGRDALVAQGIALGRDYKLVGPKTDIDTIFHGGGFYYVLSGLYIIAQGDPVVVQILAVLFHSSLVFILYYAAYLLTGNKRLSIIAPILFAVSFNDVMQARWLSNATLGLPLVGLFFLACILLVKSRNVRYWVSILPLAALLYHFQLLHLIYAVVTLLILVLAYKLPMKSRYILIGFVGALIVMAPLFVFEYKSGLAQSKAVISHLQNGGQSQNLFLSVAGFVKGWSNELQLTIFPFSAWIAVIILAGLLILYFSRYRSSNNLVYLPICFSLWALVHVFLYSKQGLAQFYSGTSLGIILLVTFLIYHLKDLLGRRLWILVGLIMVGQIYADNTFLKTEEKVFYNSFEKGIGYSTKYAVVADIYENAQEPFHINAFNVPYAQNEAWDYLFQFQGRKLSTAQAVLYQPGRGKREVAFYAKSNAHGHYRLWRIDLDKSTILLSTRTVGPFTIEERELVK